MLQVPDTELGTVALEVKEELLRYLNHKHGIKETYDAGCYGPLCTRAVRDHQREMYRRRYPNRKVYAKRRRIRELDEAIDQALIILGEE